MMNTIGHKPARLLLVDDHTILRQGLSCMLGHQDGLEVVGEAVDGREAVALAREVLPDVVIMDIVLPGLNGIEATRQILSASREVKVLALSFCADRRSVQQMFAAGASAYVLKQCAFTDLVQALHAVMAGQTYLSPSIASLVVKEYVRSTNGQHPAGGVEDAGSTALTPREREVLQLVTEGASTKQIAGTLNVSIKTVESHRAQLMRKLDLHTIAELTKYAICEGITSLGLNGETLQERQ